MPGLNPNTGAPDTGGVYSGNTGGSKPKPQVGGSTGSPAPPTSGTSGGSSGGTSRGGSSSSGGGGQPVKTTHDPILKESVPTGSAAVGTEKVVGGSTWYMSPGGSWTKANVVGGKAYNPHAAAPSPTPSAAPSPTPSPIKRADVILQGETLVSSRTGQVIAMGVRGLTTDAAGELKSITVAEGGRTTTFNPLTGEVSAVQNAEVVYSGGKARYRATGQELNPEKPEDLKRLTGLGLSVTYPQSNAQSQTSGTGFSLLSQLLYEASAKRAQQLNETVQRATQAFNLTTLSSAVWETVATPNIGFREIGGKTVAGYVPSKYSNLPRETFLEYSMLTAEQKETFDKRMAQFTEAPEYKAQLKVAGEITGSGDIGLKQEGGQWIFKNKPAWETIQSSVDAFGYVPTRESPATQQTSRGEVTRATAEVIREKGGPEKWLTLSLNLPSLIGVRFAEAGHAFNVVAVNPVYSALTGQARMTEEEAKAVDYALMVKEVNLGEQQFIEHENVKFELWKAQQEGTSGLPKASFIAATRTYPGLIPLAFAGGTAIAAMSAPAVAAAGTAATTGTAATVTAPAVPAAAGALVKSALTGGVFNLVIGETAKTISSPEHIPLSKPVESAKLFTEGAMAGMVFGATSAVLNPLGPAAKVVQRVGTAATAGGASGVAFSGTEDILGNKPLNPDKMAMYAGAGAVLGAGMESLMIVGENAPKVKYGEVKITTPEGEKIIFRDVYYSGTEGSAKPLIGLSERGVVLGEPVNYAREFPSMKKAKFPEPAPHTESYPRSELETKILGGAKGMNEMGFPIMDIAKVQNARLAMKELRNVESAYIKKNLPASTSALTEPETRIVLDVARETKPSRIYGSYASKAQVPDYLPLKPHDIELLYTTQAGAVKFDTVAAERLRNIGTKAVRDATREKLIVRGDIAVDTHYIGEPETQIASGSFSGEGMRLGYRELRPTINIRGFEVQTLGEQTVRLGGSTSNFYDVGIQPNPKPTNLYERLMMKGSRFGVESEPTRAKDVLRRYIYETTLIESGKQRGSLSSKLAEELTRATEQTRALNWRTKGVRELFSEFDADQVAFAKAHPDLFRIDITEAVKREAAAQTAAMKYAAEKSVSAGISAPAYSYFATAPRISAYPIPTSASSSSIRISPSVRQSTSISASVSKSPSISTSTSISTSPYKSPSVSPSPYKSVSISPSPYKSQSTSPSPYKSPSASASPYTSPSISPSPYTSPGYSPSPYTSPSVSPYTSPGYSPSPSNSPVSSPSKYPLLPPLRLAIKTGFGAERKKKKPARFGIKASLSGRRSLYADLFSVVRTELKYGIGSARHPTEKTHPGFMRAYEPKAYAGGKVPTAQQLNEMIKKRRYKGA